MLYYGARGQAVGMFHPSKPQESPSWKLAPRGRRPINVLTEHGQCTKEIGVRRAVGASQQDIKRQFLAESIVQCLAGGAIGIMGGFLCAVALRTFTSFRASVQTWVALLWASC